ncbi:MAG: NAD(P)H-dependent oxidoreductase [Gammaproteobacteria bacterium]|nr:NAD(P)H-dependent oxidoreductase [Gammaproteobacteria bacterium]
MNVLIIYAHPNPLSFNQSILKVINSSFKNKGATVRLKDLYAERFDPVLDEEQLSLQNEGSLPENIKREQEQVTWADTIVVIYPLWWFDRPAILKGWFDRVFTKEFAYNFDENGVQGLLTGKRAIVVVTAGGTKKDFGKNADQLTKSTTEGTLAFCGITDIVDRVFYSVPIVKAEERAKMLEELDVLVKNF